MVKEKFRLEDNPVFLRFGKLIVFLLLVFVGIVVAANNWNSRPYANIPAWYVLLPIVVLLISENAVKMWALKSYRPKIVCYSIDVLCLVGLTIFTDGELISTLHIIILSEFYLSQQSLTGGIAMCATSLGLFAISFAVSSALKSKVSITQLDDYIKGAIINGFNDLLIIVLHFLIFNFTVQIYRKNREITAAMEELNRSNEKLKAANDELKEVTALEERQRIAKDIHDTAGHSITTVIMQTEAAKLIVEQDPAEAKRRIAAANLQAKHALEELRESVHLLSGFQESSGLKGMLEAVLHESTDGTDIAVRADIDDVDLCDAKRRFVCNTLKEGISNGLRHGGATAFYFEFKERAGRVEFLLSDNGKGLDIGSLKEGFGLKGMHRRAEALGGNVWFETETDEGFEIHLTLPLDGEKGANYEN